MRFLTWEGTGYGDDSTGLKLVEEEKKGDTITMTDFERAVECLRKAKVSPPYKAIYNLES